MTMPNRATRRHPVELPNLPIPQGDMSGSKYIIGAVLEAFQSNCDCKSCQLLKRFAGDLSAALLKEEPESGHTDT